MCLLPHTVFTFVPAPTHTPQHPHVSTRFRARSLGHNQIGDEGASALAAVLKETQITKLLCAAAP